MSYNLAESQMQHVHPDTTMHACRNTVAVCQTPSRLSCLRRQTASNGVIQCTYAAVFAHPEAVHIFTLWLLLQLVAKSSGMPARQAKSKSKSNGKSHHKILEYPVDLIQNVSRSFALLCQHRWRSNHTRGRAAIIKKTAPRTPCIEA